jgi:hypothetical protein
MGKGLSITAFVLSLLFFIPFASIVGLILGIIAVKKAKGDPKALKDLAIAAIIIGVIFGILNLLTTVGFILAFIKGFSEAAAQTAALG